MSAGESSVRLTVGQALVRFLAQQWAERDGVEQRFFAGCFGIFGHGNVAGFGQALAESAHRDPAELPYFQARNEQAMVHAAVGYARMKNRLRAFACTTSIGPGATNLVTGAALATINRIPVLLLPGDIFSTRVANPVLQELEDPRSYDVSVNDTLRPVSRYWDRINRPEQLIPAALAAMRVLTDPADTGAVTLALPQDVQAESFDWPKEFFARRVWHVGRPVPEPGALDRAVEVIRTAQRPLVVAGGGVIYSEATEQLREFAELTGVPVAETQAGKGSLPWNHPSSVGAIGATGTTAANELAREADVVIGIGTRYSDFTTASRTIFARPDVRFVNINVTGFDAAKQAGESVVADARAALTALSGRLAGWAVDPAYRTRATELSARWQETVDEAYGIGREAAKAAKPGQLLAQTEVLGAVNDAAGERGVVINAAGSMPGELHKLFRTRDPKQYHVEYGYSCMGYEIAAGLGVKMADPDREVIVLVGDGSYLMLAQEIVTAVQEGVKLTIVLVQNHGYASIGSLSESVGSERFATSYRYRNPKTGALDGDVLPVDLAANAASLGADVIRAGTIDELRSALDKAREATRTTLVHVETDPLGEAPSSQAWWDVPVASVSTLEATRRAREEYDEHKPAQRHYL
ncbi:3D-(3,5/4)-trihydroxycyclohexane-1,2-dione acylhydrolase (decyclizing) [Actinopolymorpha pittospori]|uniref:3D-(3,5/4)-trihydroxycyclohexane-1,2-dione acylhydrolase (Decyclizing) n=1 Tax=Actinopolymorpha pittospori TaxID=648752 RepID=A0A927RG72_9ACTN|nr:3D-(3,5/4)-trihydroxycyclohexane-1,2-dione acylhydrolase (decyclizing) [Actinopolymorpha pittospori]MBE1610890.1 3D-(3,5/4)-trihydroxycyclohexane-1,2-dione acylhydrolase (decyclizing) [Actinopolymorpha pittospori]